MKKKACRRLLLAAWAGLALAGCRPGASPAANPVDWLRGQPFEPAPSAWPDVIVSALPAGFEVDGPDLYLDELGSGEYYQMILAWYDRRAQAQGPVEDAVEVDIVAYDSLAGRLEHLDLFGVEGYEWSFRQLEGGQVARYQSGGVDGRMWIAGPYLIVVFEEGGSDGAWADTFAELYLAQPPVPGAISASHPLDWLRARPFEAAPAEWPDMITSGLPDGFEAEEPVFYTDELPGGEGARIASVQYGNPLSGIGSASGLIEAAMLGYPSVDARSEHLDRLVGQEVVWSFEQRSGAHVVRYRMGGDDGRMWVSGPNLIAVVGAEEDGAWVEAFADLYLAEYPAE